MNAKLHSQFWVQNVGHITEEIATVYEGIMIAIDSNTGNNRDSLVSSA